MPRDRFAAHTRLTDLWQDFHDRAESVGATVTPTCSRSELRAYPLVLIEYDGRREEFEAPTFRSACNRALDWLESATKGDVWD